MVVVVGGLRRVPHHEEAMKRCSDLGSGRAGRGCRARLLWGEAEDMDMDGMVTAAHRAPERIYLEQGSCVLLD